MYFVYSDMWSLVRSPYTKLIFILGFAEPEMSTVQ